MAQKNQEERRQAWAPSDSVYGNDDEELEWNHPVSKEELTKVKSRGLDACGKCGENEDSGEESGESKGDNVEEAGPSVQKRKGHSDKDFAPNVQQEQTISEFSAGPSKLWAKYDIRSRRCSPCQQHQPKMLGEDHAYVKGVKDAVALVRRMALQLQAAGRWPRNPAAPLLSPNPEPEAKVDEVDKKTMKKIVGEILGPEIWLVLERNRECL
ncbi:hypothetical protein FRC06_011901 [Ceratobasidium sp. 370]|nr:hypothetical protein FRC06_011901 [Ceratobasidium sp. 370]